MNLSSHFVKILLLSEDVEDDLRAFVVSMLASSCPTIDYTVEYNTANHAHQIKCRRNSRMSYTVLKRLNHHHLTLRYHWVNMTDLFDNRRPLCYTCGSEPTNQSKYLNQAGPHLA